MVITVLKQGHEMRIPSILLLAITLPAWAGSRGDEHPFGPAYQATTVTRPGTDLHRGRHRNLSTLRRWNRIAIDASGLDHTPVAPGETRTFGEQLGPCRSSRAMAIVHIAIFDCVNAVAGVCESYTGHSARQRPISVDAAISQTAHDTLTALYPSQARQFSQWLAEDLAEIKNKIARGNGVDVGRRVAATILALRSTDGSQHAEPYLGSDHLTRDSPGHWRQDPISLIPIALGAYWNGCVPFTMESASQFRVPPPPALTSPEYAAAFNEAKWLGGDGVNTPTGRTPEQTHIGFFWAYDGMPSLCAPPRMYNQIAIQIAIQMGSDEFEVAWLLALVNVAMADAAIAVWDSKYFYDFWRPVTGIREADPGTGPTGAGDDNPETLGDAEFHSLGAPASNLTGPNFTPPFPAYPSGHAGFGGAAFQILRRFYGTDAIPFTFVSDEFNGVTRDNFGDARPFLPRHFESLSQAEEENGQSRIYLGIHWSFDKTAGIAQGRLVGDHVFDHVFRPLPPRAR
jgi:membrane-associated phospholipid phosphatase